MTSPTPPIPARSPGPAPLAQLLTELGLPDARVTPIRNGDVNQHWHLTHPTGRWVLRRYQSWRPPAAISYEHQLLARLAAHDWPVAPPHPTPTQASVVCLDGHAWSVFPRLPGRQPPTPGTHSEGRRYGRLLAHLHQTTQEFCDLGPRPGFPALTAPPPPAPDDLLTHAHPDLAAAIHTQHTHLQRQLDRLRPAALPQAVLHGDFSAGNLLYHHGRLSGLLDFDSTRLDARPASPISRWPAPTCQPTRPRGSWPATRTCSRSDPGSWRPSRCCAAPGSWTTWRFAGGCSPAASTSWPS